MLKHYVAKHTNLCIILIPIVLSILLPSCIIPTYTGKSSLKETQKKDSSITMSNLLIVGAGSTASRVFLESFSDELIKLFAQQNIKCDFIYVGKIRRRTHFDIDKMIASKYDSYLLLNPTDTSYADLHKQVAVVGAPIGGGYAASGSVIGNQYKDDYYVELYTNNNNKPEEVWEGQLKVDFDFGQPRMYKKIAQSIFDKIK